jgi:hypothetical protein
MPNCPYCNQELNLRLTAQYISEIDSNYYKAVNSLMDQMPRLFRGILRNQFDRMQKYPILAEIVLCAECDRVLDLNLQRMQTT